MPTLQFHRSGIKSTLLTCLGIAQTQNDGQGTSAFEGGDDFLSREKALLGDDADQFATGNDNAAYVEDGDDDLLGGGGGYSGGNEEVTEFESSFPAIDTSNEVCLPKKPPDTEWAEANGI